MGVAMPYLDLDSQAKVLLETMAGTYADRYISELMLPHLQAAIHADTPSIQDITALMLDPYVSLQAFYAHYAFARRGRDRRELADLAVQALKRVTSRATIVDLLRDEDGSQIWDAFSELCCIRHRKPAEQLNRGLIGGMVELAQEIFALDEVGSISNWIVQGVLQTGRIEPQFLRIVDIRGVGPKTTSTFLRDLVFLYNVEGPLDHQDRLFVQPVDRWLRLMSAYVIPEDGVPDAADWIIAGKIAKYARRAGVSGVRFNMGSTFFGLMEVQNPSRFRECINALVGADARHAQAGPKPNEGHLA